jgi:hypothetical protein
MNLGTTRLSGRPRNRWQDEVTEDGRIVGGEGWQEKLCNREEWKKLLRTARNRHILHMPMERMNEYYFQESLCKHNSYAHSLRCKRLVLALSYLPVCRHVSVLLPLDGVL